MVLQMNVDIVKRTTTFGAPSTQWWSQLATAVAGGLTFATVLTLVLTPCMLVLGDRLSQRFNKNKPVMVVTSATSMASSEFDDEQHVVYSSEKRSAETITVNQLD